MHTTHFATNIFRYDLEPDPDDHHELPHILALSQLIALSLELDYLVAIVPGGMSVIMP